MANEILWSRLGNNLVNGRPSTPSGTPTTINTTNTGAFTNGYYGNPRSATSQDSTVENGVVTYNPQNWNWGYNNLIGTYNNNNTTYQPFTVADTLNQRAQGYQAQGLDGLANSYKTLNRENNIYNSTANKITDYYTALANDINSRENALAQRKESLANQLSQDIANQRQYVTDYFGPNGIFTNELNRYYDDQGNYLASEAGRQIAMANAEGIQSGASLGAQRAARNEAYNNAFQNYLKVKEQELNAKMQIQQQLINYMNALRQEYGETQNTYVISQYQRANDLLNALSTDLAQQNSNIALGQLQKATASSGSSNTNDLTDIITRLESGNYERDAKGVLTPAGKAQLAVDTMYINQLGGTVKQNGNYFGRYDVDLSNSVYMNAFNSWVDEQKNNTTSEGNSNDSKLPSNNKETTTK